MRKSVKMRSLAGIFAGLLAVQLLASGMPIQATTPKKDRSGYTPISTAAELDAIRNDLTGKYYLTGDIVFTEADFAEGGAFYNEGAGWAPIGTDRFSGFTGVLDGNGFSVKNYRIDLQEESSSLSCNVGLFGYVTGEICDLTIADSRISATISGGHLSVGAIAGDGSGTFRNCANVNTPITADNTSGTVYAGGLLGGVSGEATIENCTNSGAVTASNGSVGNYAQAGGIVGSGNSSVDILHCSNTGQIHVNNARNCYANAGGMGCGVGSVRNCTNTGAVIAKGDRTTVGGIVSGAQTITGCKNTGAVYGKRSGGIVGYFYGDIRDCVNGSDSVAGWQYVGGIVGEAGRATVENCHNSGAVKPEGSSYDPQRIAAGAIVGYGYKATVISCDNLGTVLSQTDAESIAGGIVGECEYTDIRYCHNQGPVTVMINQENFADNVCYAGGIAGYILSTRIDYCHNGGAVTAHNEQKNDRVNYNSQAYAYAGGLAGSITGADTDDGTGLTRISNSYNAAQVKAVAANHWAYGTAVAGGLVATGYEPLGGQTNTLITDCYNIGAVLGDTALSSRSSKDVGGLAGQINSVKVVNCYNTAPATYGIVDGAKGGIYQNCYYSDQSQSGIGNSYGAQDTATKCTAAQMQKKSTYAGFDFDTVWTVGADKYPQLRNNIPGLTGIEIHTLPRKLSYQMGEDVLDVTGGTITAHYTDSSATVDMTADMVQGFDNTVAGECRLTVVYGGRTCSYTVKIARTADFNGDGLVTNADVIYLLWYTVFPEDYPISGDADFTGDGEITNEDVIYLLWYTVFPEDYPLS